MLTVFRGGAHRVTGFLRGSVNLTQVCSLTGITTRGEPLKLKKPFPYWKRYLTEIEALMDITIKRVEEENAKIIVVEGPIASGKSPFMKQLAEEFEMLCMDQPTMDVLYKTRTGFDLRTLDDQLPETVRTFDHKNFCMCPTSCGTGNFQVTMFLLRFSHYVDALTHILNTGQGVVMERSPFSDFVFMEALCAEGYVSKNVRDYYMDMLEVAKPLLLRPHLVIYLDVPVNKVQENIKKRNLSYEVNSPALTPSYLQKLEDGWKKKYLNNASEHSEVLVYDWSEGGDTELVIEDLEKLNLDPMESGADYGLFGDWKMWRREWRDRRRRYTNNKMTLMKYLLIPTLRVPEILAPVEDLELRKKLYRTAPGFEYMHGYNPLHGDNMFKTMLGIPTSISRTPTYLIQI